MLHNTGERDSPQKKHKNAKGDIYNNLMLHTSTLYKSMYMHPCTLRGKIFTSYLSFASQNWNFLHIS
jgi:hypothetical protein